MRIGCGSKVISSLIECFLFAAPLIGQDAKRRPELFLSSERQHKTTITRLQITDVLALIEQEERDVLTENRVIQIITEHGLAFTATRENLLKLKENGAHSTILNLITKLSPAPPPPAIKGAIKVTCAPAECDVSIDDKHAGTTTNGSLTRSDIDLKEILVGFVKDGYLSEQHTVSIQPDNVAQLSVKLEPTAASQTKFGLDLFAAMLGALGDEAGMHNLTAEGSITSFSGRVQNNWDFRLGLAAPFLLAIDLSSDLSGTYLFRCRGETCVLKKKGRTKANDVAATALDNNLRLFSEYNLGSVIDRLRTEGATMSATTGLTEGKVRRELKVETHDGIFLLQIDPDLFPSEISYDSKSGLLAGMKITYGDFVKVGKVSYPKRTDIKLPGAIPQGIELRMTSLVAESDIREKHFPK